MKILQKIIYLTFLSVATISSFSVYAANPADNVNSSSFMVDLSNMDPLKGSHLSGASQGGVSSLLAIIANITDILLVLIPIIAVISMLIAGYFYIFSAGDSAKADRAKTIIKWNIVAIFISLLSFGIVKIVASFFN